MSRANASAIQRRAGIVEKPPTITPPTQPNMGLTLPQVILLVDTRLIKLEQFMKETLENNSSSTLEIRGTDTNTSDDPNQLTDLNDIIQEYNNRFIMLAEEIGELKDIVLKLQTYTMDVNKMLMEEREHNTSSEV